MQAFGVGDMEVPFEFFTSIVQSPHLACKVTTDDVVTINWDVVEKVVAEKHQGTASRAFCVALLAVRNGTAKEISS